MGPAGVDLVGRNYIGLAMAGCRARSLDLMERYVEPGIAWCEERDRAVWGRILLATRSWVALERGDWDRAAETVELVFMEDCTLSCAQARIVLTLLRARRGDPDPWTPLEQAREVAERTGQLWWTWQIAAAEAEALWLGGRPEAIADATADTFDLAVRNGSPWVVAELAWWRRQGGVDEPVPEEAAGPFELQLRGDWSGAEAAWREAGCSYQAALAQAETGDEAALRSALEELQRLGARPAAAIVARRLRERVCAGSRADSGPPRRRIPPTSRRARSRCSPWWPRASGTRRSRSDSSCPSGPSLTTSPRSCESSASEAVQRRRPRPSAWGWRAARN